MKLTFRDITSEMFDKIFPDDIACLEWLALHKWSDGYICRKCGHTRFCKGKKPHSRRCTVCKSEESATAHTPFHRCRIPLREAFRIAWICCNSPLVSSASLSSQLDIRQMTCWKFKKKILGCMEMSQITHYL